MVRSLRTALVLSLMLVPTAAQAAASRLLITQVILSPSEAEAIAIHNPGSSAVSDLANYYLSDLDTYHKLMTATPATVGASDFIMKFPASSSIAAGATIWISIGGAECFKTACGSTFTTGYAQYPDYEVLNATAAKSSTSVPDMVAAYTNSIGSSAGITNGGEPLILFYWEGAQGTNVVDVDYVYAGGSVGSTSNPAVNKTGVGTYLADTAESASTHSPISTGYNYIATCRVTPFAEGAQKTTGGNGVGGTDQTSEDTLNTFQACTAVGPNNTVPTWVPVDAGMGGDTGPKADTGGGTAGPDAAGTPGPDASTVQPGPDAGEEPAGEDAATAAGRDASAPKVDAGGGGDNGGGCSCSTTGLGFSTLAGLLVLGLFARRRP